METTFFSRLGDCKNTPRRYVKTKREESRPLYQFSFRNNWTFNRLATPSLRVVQDVAGVVYDTDLNTLA